jgi:sugar phosphate isomerase/epimerase
LPGETLVEKFRAAAQFGYAGVELTAWGFPGPMPDFASDIRAAIETSGVPVSSLCTMGSDDFVHPDPAERKKRLAALIRMLELADGVGARGVVALPIRPPTHLPDLSPVASERQLIAQVAVAVLKAAVESTPGGRAAIFLEPLNRYEAYYLRTLADAASLCTEAGHPRIQIMADMFHMSIEEADIAASLRAAAGRVGHLHLADSNRLLPGHGHTDFVNAFAALKEINFEGWLALECGVPGNPAQTLPAAAAFLKTCWDQA